MHAWTSINTCSYDIEEQCIPEEGEEEEEEEEEGCSLQYEQSRPSKKGGPRTSRKTHDVMAVKQ